MMTPKHAMRAMSAVLAIVGLMSLVLSAVLPRIPAGHPQLDACEGPLSARAASAAASGPAEGRSPSKPDSGAPRRLVFLGWDFDVWGIAWYLLLLTVEIVPWWRKATDDVGSRFRFYSLCLSVVGCAAVFAGINAASFEWRLVGATHAVAGLCVLGLLAIGLMSAQAPGRPLAPLLFRDASCVVRAAPTWLCLAILAAGVAVSKPSVAAATRGPTGDAFEPWFAALPRLSVPFPIAKGEVAVVRVADYQCPVCRSAEEYYRPLWAELASSGPSNINLATLDFPLDAECNPYVVRTRHDAACEAAAAVALATERGVAQAMEDWLWQHQDGMSAGSVFDAARSITGVHSVEAEYPRLLRSVRAQVEVAHSLGVDRTPTYFVNGATVGFLPRRYMRVAIEHELRASRRSPAAAASADRR